jgi:YVTN family beta-propeller protein
MNSYDRVSVARKGMEMADDVTDQDKAATVPKVEAACAAAISLVIAAKAKTTIAISISIAIMFAVVVTGEVAIVTPKPPPSQCKVSVVYVVSSVDETAFVIATDKNQVVATVPTGFFPWTIAVTPDGTRAYVANFNRNTVSVIDTVTNSLLTTIPRVNNTYGLRGLAISPDGTRVYVPHLLNTTSPGAFSTIDTVTNQVISTIPLNIFPGVPYNMVVHPDGTRAYIAGFTPGIVVFDIVKQLVIDVVPVVPRMLGMAITPDGTQLYLTPEDIYYAHKNGVTVVDTTTDQVKAFIPIPLNQSCSVAVSPDGKRAYAVSFGSMGVVTVIDTTTNLALEHIPFPTIIGYFGVVVSVDGTKAYVVDGDHTVFVIDTATNKVIGDIVLVGTFHLSATAIAAAWIPC